MLFDLNIEAIVSSLVQRVPRKAILRSHSGGKRSAAAVVDEPCDLGDEPRALWYRIDAERRGDGGPATGHGDVPWEDCFRALNTIGYDGPISIEWEDAGMDRLVGAPEALQFVRRLAFDAPAAAFDAAFSSSS